MMTRDHDKYETGCGCDCGYTRREFMAAAAVTGGAAAFTTLGVSAADSVLRTGKEAATVRAAFMFPPSKVFADDPDGWWSWPGNQFDVEGRQQEYLVFLSGLEKELGMEITIEPGSIGNASQAKQFAEGLRANPPDGLLLIMFYNNSLSDADLILNVANEIGLPAVFYIGLGVKHGGIAHYRRPGLYFIQSLDNYDAIRAGMRMINTKKVLGQSRVLSINGEERKESVERFFGIATTQIPVSHYEDAFARTEVTKEARAFIAGVRTSAKKTLDVSEEAFDNAARAHFTLLRLMEEENADAVTMNCLRRGMLKPCISFAELNNQLVPAACENDLPAVYTQMLGQLLIGRPGFQHNPCYETEKNHYYGSHCTCPTKVYGPGGKDLPYLLRKFAHSNEGSCAIQVFWNPGDPVTMVRYYPGDEPALDVYAGQVAASHPMPPAGGCTTNVELAITDRRDACMVKGHHNLLFCGDYARRFRLFAQLHRMRLAQTGFEGTWPA